ncbi:MAG: peptidoglycan editing factor PgeF [Pseudomonadota bacterium]|nr:peptidoglycan editing factor PgeF [Pseudomonadota bacterium]
MPAAWLHADWPAPPTVRAFTTLRHGLGESAAPFDHFNLGNRSGPDGDDPEVVARNRQRLIEHARLPSAPHWLRQVHATQVRRFDWCGGGASEAASEPDAGLEPQADAAVSATPGSVLAILTADCLPVLLCTGDASRVGAAHAGWRGLAAGVLENTVAAMDSSPERMLAWLGPAAGPQNYEVGVEVYDAFVAPDWSLGSAFVSTRPHHWRVDLYALARRRLIADGLRPENIHGGGLCTIADPERFYSHRRDRRTGRMASLIWIDPGRD